MRILVVSCACPPFHGGGVARLIDELSSRLGALGHAVTVFTRHTGASYRRGELTWSSRPGYEVAAVNLAEQDFFDRYITEDYLNPITHEPFRRVVEEFRPDIVHFHSIQSLGAGLLDWIPRGVRTILTMHDFWWVCPNIFLMRLDDRLCRLTQPNLAACTECLGRLAVLNPARVLSREDIRRRDDYLGRQLRRFDRILTVSHFLRDRLAGFLPDLLLGVCENGLNLDVLKASGVVPQPGGRIPARRNGVLRFGFVGGCNSIKGFDCVTAAVCRLQKYSFEVQVHGCRGAWMRRLAVKIPGSDRLIRAVLRRNVPPAGGPLDARIRLFPLYDFDKWPQVYASFDVLLVPSIVLESYSLVCREALVVGVPVIASRCGGPEEVIRHEVNGLLFEPNNPQELAECMARCLEEPDLLSSLQVQARADGIRTINQQVEQLVGEYRALGSPP